METRLITNDQQLRRYLPNAFDTVEGETTFYEKIMPWLDQAERWVFTQFIGDDFAPELLAMEETEPLRTCATLVVVHEAFMRAVPSLDLVLTPNGFGIVSNQNITPASPHRISRLLGSLETSRDIAIEQLIHNLFLNSTWSASPKRQWFSATLFRTSTWPTCAVSPNTGGRTTWACAPRRSKWSNASPRNTSRQSNWQCSVAR